MTDLVNLFPDIDIDILEADLLLGVNNSYHFVHCLVLQFQLNIKVLFNISFL